MDSSLGTGIIAVFAVSGSVIYIAMQAHNRLLSSFVKKMGSEIQHSTARNQPKKKVRFADEVTESTTDEYCGRRYKSTPAALGRNVEEHLEGMPQNWQAMYKGILKCRRIERHN